MSEDHISEAADTLKEPKSLQLLRLYINLYFCEDGTIYPRKVPDSDHSSATSTPLTLTGITLQPELSTQLLSLNSKIE